ncbi:MAG: LuxR C-terminal-related transcriptional regulator [Candidatus Cryptobacteroides sp.]
MAAAIMISLACVVSFWYILKEYPSLYGVIIPTCVLRRRLFKVIVIVSASFAASFAAFVAHRGGVALFPSGTATYVYAVTAVSALLAVFALEFMGIPSSAALAVFGAVEGARIMAVQYYSPDYAALLFWAVAAVSVTLLSLLVYTALRWLIRHTKVHFLKLSEYMRYAVIIAVILLSAGIGYNYGDFIAGIACGHFNLWITIPLVVVVFALPQLIMWRMAENLSDLVSEKCEEWNTMTILSVIVSLSIVYIGIDLFFGADMPPVAPVPLVYAGIVGVEIARRRIFIENESAVRAISGLFVVPVTAFLISLMILRLTGSQSTGSGLGDFSVILLVLAVALFVISANYVSAQVRKKKEMERIMYAQQNEIFENNRALNEMEIKTVLSENRLLHDTLELKRKEAMNIALSICEQKEYLETLNDIAGRIPQAASDEDRNALVSELQASIKRRLSFDQEIDSFYFYAQAEAVHKDFALRLSERFPSLTEQDKRLVTLLRLGFSSKYIAALMNVSTKTVEIGRYRLRQKLKLSKGDNLVNFIKTL